MTRRYEIFVSSTSKDLHRERQRVRDIIVRQGHLPVVMEDFDVAHRPAWETTDRALQQADYYVLIVGDRYGAIEKASGISYTEKEYRRARELKKPALVLLRESRRKASKRRTSAERQLDAFKTRLRSELVVTWRNTDHLIDQILEHLPRWLRMNEQPGGWVPARDYAFRRDAYAFLLNGLLPFDGLTLADNALRNRSLRSMSDVIEALTSILDGYRQTHLAAGMRAYFAYKLKHRVRVKEKGLPAYTVVHYRIGISSAAEGAWRKGLGIGLSSNVEMVYDSATARAVEDASSFSTEVGNQIVGGEKSVIAAPVMFGSSPIGAIGFSSPRSGEAAGDVYKDLAREVQTVASALFYAYAQAGGKTPTVKEMRDQIAEALDARLAPLMR